MTRDARLALGRQIIERLVAVYGDRITAAGFYGSVARGSDGPYSDIEILCVLRDAEGKRRIEWTPGPWKAEVNLYHRDAPLARAAEIDDRWPVTHGAYCHVLPVHDLGNFFEELRTTVLAQPDERFCTAIQQLIVDELYEDIGKLRNAQESDHREYLPSLAFNIAGYGACLLSLAHRVFYTSRANMLEESLRIDDRPTGYDALANIVMSGDLVEPQRVTRSCEAFWHGVETWAAAKGIVCEASVSFPF